VTKPMALLYYFLSQNRNSRAKRRHF